jgi:DNA polymerase III subunit gamma/tau
LTHSSAPLAKRLSEQRNADVIAEALKDALGVNWRVRCETGGAAPVTSDPAPPPASGGVNPPVPQAPPAPTDVPAVVDSGQQDDDEEHMLAEAGRADPQVPRRDPEEVALELLQTELGARRIDNGQAG